LITIYFSTIIVMELKDEEDGKSSNEPKEVGDEKIFASSISPFSMYDANYKKLHKLAPFAKSNVFVCQDIHCHLNFCKNTTKWNVDENSNWIVNLLCTKCNNTWKICCTCNNFSKPLITKTQVNNHRHAYHNANSKRKRSKNVAY
jgi:hypothetical protein